MNRRRIKSYGIAVILVILFALDIFWLGDILGIYLGLLGTVISEALLIVIAVGVFWIFRGKLKVIFPFKKPEWSKTAATVLIWFGANGLAMSITMFLAFFFPEEMLSASDGIQDTILGGSVIVSLLVISLTPAICEEISFRGALQSCFRCMKSRWAAIIITSLIFGAFHGSIWRMIPTALLGIAMGYLLFETENMFYNMLFHFINNAWSVILLAGMQALMELLGMAEVFTETMEATSAAEVPIATLGGPVMGIGRCLFFLYIGNYLLHKGQPGYDKGIFPKEKRKVLITLLSVTLVFMGIGFVMLCIPA